MQLKKTDSPGLYNTILIVLLLILCTPLVSKADSVTGRYLKASGNTTILEISIGKPAPQSIIVEQSLGNKNTIQSVSPKPKKTSGNGNIKWLLTKTRPGKRKFTVKLTTPLNGSVRATLKFRDPVSGQFIEKNITP